jgi:hypothetical protein
MAPVTNFFLQYSVDDGVTWTSIPIHGGWVLPVLQTVSLSLPVTTEMSKLKLRAKVTHAIGSTNDVLKIYEIWTEGQA